MMPKYMDPKEFRELGILQEANRMFFHPLGLALEMSRNSKTGREWISGIQDGREDPEGIAFKQEDLDLDLAVKVADMFGSKYENRCKLFKKQDSHIQPILQKRLGIVGNNDDN